MKADEAREFMDVDSETAADRLKKKAAVLVGVLAMFLAINGLAGANAAKEILNNNIYASNTYAFYQAKTIRQTAYRIAADELEVGLQAPAGASDAATTRQRLQRYLQTISRYESEPDTGEGRKELLVKARAFEARRDHAQRQDPYFDYAEALLQIAIVLSSVSIIAGSAVLLGGGAAIGGVAVLLMLNGFFLVYDLPFLG